jgi:hypothetical protein
LDLNFLENEEKYKEIKKGTVYDINTQPAQALSCEQSLFYSSGTEEYKRGSARRVLKFEYLL